MLITQTWNDEFLRWNVGENNEENNDDFDDIGEVGESGEYIQDGEFFYSDDYFYDDDDYYTIENDNPSVISVFAYQVWKPDLGCIMQQKNQQFMIKMVQ